MARRGRVDLPLRGALPGPPVGEGLAVQGAPLHLQIGPGQIQGPQQALHRAMRLRRGLHQDDGGDGLHRLPLLQCGAGNVPHLLRGRAQNEELLERGPLVRDGPLGDAAAGLDLLRPFRPQGGVVALREGPRQRHNARDAWRALQEPQQVLRAGLQGGAEASGALRRRPHHNSGPAR